MFQKYQFTSREWLKVWKIKYFLFLEIQRNKISECVVTFHVNLYILSYSTGGFPLECALFMLINLIKIFTHVKEQSILMNPFCKTNDLYYMNDPSNSCILKLHFHTPALLKAK